MYTGPCQKCGARIHDNKGYEFCVVCRQANPPTSVTLAEDLMQLTDQELMLVEKTLESEWRRRRNPANMRPLRLTIV